MMPRPRLNRPRLNSGRLTRLVRGRRLDGNPLRRTNDRAQTIIFIALAVMFFVAAPIIIKVAGNMVHSGSARQVRTERTELAYIPATVLQRPEAGNALAYESVTVPMAQAKWTAPDGQPRTGLVPVPGHAAPGTRVMVWTDRQGVLSGPPIQASQVAEQADVAEIFAVLSLALVLLTAGWITIWTLDRRRLRAWAAAWKTTEPRWTARRENT